MNESIHFPDMDDDVVLPHLSDEEIRKEVSSQADQLSEMAQGLTQPFHVLMKSYFDLPPKSSIRAAATATGISRKRLERIRDGLVDPTDKEIEQINGFMQKDLIRVRKIREQKSKTKVSETS